MMRRAVWTAANGVRSGMSMQGRRMYAEDASGGAKADSLLLTFACPHNTLLHKKPVRQITVPGDGGEFGILANHVPITSQLSPGVVILDYAKSAADDPAAAAAQVTHYFVSGGYVSVFDDSSVALTCPEAVPLHHLSVEVVRDHLAKYSHDEKSASDPEHRKNAAVAAFVFKSMLDAIEKYKSVYDELSAKLA